MNRLFSFVLLFALLMSVSVFGHGLRALDVFKMPDGFDTSIEYNIVFWAKNDSNKAQKDIYKKAIADFEAIYPNIHVEMRSFTDYKLIYQEVLTNIGTQTTPNVCITYPDHIATYLTGVNVVAPLDDLLTNEKYGLAGTDLKFSPVGENGIVERFLNEGVFDGHHFALPFMRSTEALYINVDYVEKLGYSLPDTITWDFVWEVSEAAMEKDENGLFKLNNDKVLIPFIYKSTDNMMITMLKQRGGEYSDENGNVLILNNTTRAILEEIYPHAYSRAFSTFSISSYPGNYLNAGQCIFAIDSTAGATWMGSDAPNMDIHSNDVRPFNIEVRMIPQYDTDNPKMISQGPSICVFNKKDPQEVLASWLFAQYLLSDETQIAYSKTEGYIPVTNTAHNSDAYKDYLSRRGEDNKIFYSVKIDAAKLTLENIDNTFVTPVFNGSASLRSAAGQLVEEITMAGRQRKELTKDLIDSQFTSVNSLYRLDSIGSASCRETELGELPSFPKYLLISIASIWFVIVLSLIVRLFKAKKTNKN